jgi:aspartyl-tRNA(Asn)/glutamyl-tRNA(Gln) amidotransferase subunit A
LTGTTENTLTGATRNPWNPHHIAGGSSGGAAAAVAAGCGPIALATDGGGSIRRPAAYCGLVGFKPSAGRVPRDGGLPEILLDFEIPGPISRTVADAHRLVQALASEAPHEIAEVASARILYVPRFGSQVVDPAIAASVAEAAKQFEALGHKVEEAASFELADRVNACWPVLSGAGLAWMLSEASTLGEFGLGPGEAPDVGLCTPAIQEGLCDALQTDAASLFEVFAAVHALRGQLAQLFAQHDFVLTPAAAAMPWPAEDAYPPTIAGEPAGPRGHAVFTAFANAAGVPAIALPCGAAHGVPIGLQLVGKAGTDTALLALASQYERARPWVMQWPALD